MSEQKPTKNKDDTAEIILVVIGFFFILVAVISLPELGSGKGGSDMAPLIVAFCAPIGIIAIIIGIIGLLHKK